MWDIVHRTFIGGMAVVIGFVVFVVIPILVGTAIEPMAEGGDAWCIGASAIVSICFLLWLLYCIGCVIS